MSTASATWPAPSARVEPGVLRAGDEGRVVVSLEVPAGCHVQSHAPREPFLVPTTVVVDPAPGVDVRAAEFPEPDVERFEWTLVELDVHRGRLEVVVPIAVRAREPGHLALDVRMRFQGCTATACLPPVEHHVDVEAAISA